MTGRWSYLSDILYSRLIRESLFGVGHTHCVIISQFYVRSIGRVNYGVFCWIYFCFKSLEQHSVSWIFPNYYFLERQPLTFWHDSFSLCAGKMLQTNLQCGSAGNSLCSWWVRILLLIFIRPFNFTWFVKFPASSYIYRIHAQY